MPLSLNQIANNEASVTFPYAGDTLTIVYYPSRISDKMLRSLAHASTDSMDGILDAFGSLNDMLAKIIKSWDLYKDDEQKIMWPINPESMSELPVFFKQDILLKITENMNPKSKAV